MNSNPLAVLEIENNKETGTWRGMFFGTFTECSTRAHRVFSAILSENGKWRIESATFVRHPLHNIYGVLTVNVETRY